MKISVIIPIYKVENYLDECIESVLCQSYKDIEVILVDDGSPDRCPEICDEYAKKDSRVKVIHKQNGGLSDARNVGLAASTGEFIVFLDSDDYWDDQDVLKKFIDIYNQYPSLELVQFFSKIDINGEIIYRNYPKIDFDIVNNSSLEETLSYLFARNIYPVSAWSKFIRRSILIDHGIWFEKGLLSEDYDWYFKVLNVITDFKLFPEIFYVYRLREGSITHSISDKHLSDVIWIIKKWTNYYGNYRTSRKSNLMFQILGYLYAMLLSLVYKGSNKDEYIKQINGYKYLLKFDMFPKTRIVLWMTRLLGLRLTITMLGYRNLKKRK